MSGAGKNIYLVLHHSKSLLAFADALLVELGKGSISSGMLLYCATCPCGGVSCRVSCPYFLSSKLTIAVELVMSFRVSTGWDLIFEHVAQGMRTSATTYVSQQTLRTYSLAKFHVATSLDVDTSAKRSKCDAYRGFALLISLDAILFRCMLG